MTTLQTPPSTAGAAEEPTGDAPPASNDSAVDNVLSFLKAVGERMRSAHQQVLAAELEKAQVIQDGAAAFGERVWSAYELQLWANLRRARMMLDPGGGADNGGDGDWLEQHQKEIDEHNESLDDASAVDTAGTASGAVVDAVGATSPDTPAAYKGAADAWLRQELLERFAADPKADIPDGSHLPSAQRPPADNSAP